MRDVYAQTMFSEPSKRLQERAGSREMYERMAWSERFEDGLSEFEREFIEARDSFYMATVTPDGWPYIQHRGGPAGFLKVMDEKTLAFADYSGNKQYISAGNLSVNDRVSLFLMDYPDQARLKIIGHTRVLSPGESPEIEKQLLKEFGAKVESVVAITVAGYDWNCSQHITPRFTKAEILQFNS
ncbi:MAG: pyridoxamine 5'-phosphate oxidase family protein [Acidobacteria bacterium]|nr:pyridoxamine 5'-phosphate oxidase family protein [Acidobacteriota bacterium]